MGNPAAVIKLQKLPESEQRLAQGIWKAYGGKSKKKVTKSLKAEAKKAKTLDQVVTRQFERMAMISDNPVERAIAYNEWQKRAGK